MKKKVAPREMMERAIKTEALATFLATLCREEGAQRAETIGPRRMNYRGPQRGQKGDIEEITRKYWRTKEDLKGLIKGSNGSRRIE